MPLMRPDVYARLTLATRTTPGSNRPRAVLFEGPPGTGRTLLETAVPLKQCHQVTEGSLNMAS